MRLYNEDKWLLHHPLHWTYEGNILRSKGLYEQSHKRLLKAKRKALEYQQWEAAIKINLQLIDQAHQQIERNLGVKIQDLFTENQSYLRQYQYEQIYAGIFYELFVLQRTRKLSPEEWSIKLERIFDYPELITLPDTPSFFTAYYYYSTWALGFRLKGQKEKAFKFYNKLRKHWETNGIFQKIHQEKYKISLANYLNSCHSIGRYQDFEEILHQIKSIKSNGFDEEAESFQNIVHLNLLYILNKKYDSLIDYKAQFDDKYILYIKKGLSEYHSKINSGRRFVIKLNVAILVFAAQYYQASSEWGLAIWDDTLSEHRLDIQIFGKIIYLISFYELKKNDDALEELDLKRDAFYKYVRSKYSNTKVEKHFESFISCFNSLLYALVRQDYSKAEHEIFNEFYQKKESGKMVVNTHLKNAHNFTFLWARTYVEQKPFWKLMQE
ncbi:MAG: hypothetical protein MI974_00195 [Chitinophagales bacterium]|nr:hypothetical protein [Chitinophagales bacterium]